MLHFIIDFLRVLLHFREVEGALALVLPFSVFAINHLDKSIDSMMFRFVDNIAEGVKSNIEFHGELRLKWRVRVKQMGENQHKAPH